MEITIKATPNEAAEFFRTLADYRGGISLTGDGITIDGTKIASGSVPTVPLTVRGEDRW